MGERRVLLGDDHTMLRRGLKKILEDCRIVAETGNGRDAPIKTLPIRMTRGQAASERSCSWSQTVAAAGKSETCCRSVLRLWRLIARTSFRN